MSLRSAAFEAAAYAISPLRQFILIIGGAEEDRTPDPLHAMQVLSQLSYSPVISY